MTQKFLLALHLILLTGFTSSPCFGQSTSASASSFNYIGDYEGGPSETQLTESGPSAVSVNWIKGAASSTADFGFLSVGAAISHLSNTTPASRYDSLAESTFDDQLIISNFIGDGYVELDFIVNGSAAVSATEWAQALTGFDIRVNGINWGRNDLLSSGTYGYDIYIDPSGYDVPSFLGTTQSASLAFPGGSPVGLSVSLRLGASAYLNPRPSSESASAQGEFSLEVTGLRIRDSLGNLASGYTVSSASGKDYVTPVPEPSIYGMMIVGFALILLVIARQVRLKEEIS